MGPNMPDCLSNDIKYQCIRIRLLIHTGPRLFWGICCQILPPAAPSLITLPSHGDLYCILTNHCVTEYVRWKLCVRRKQGQSEKVSPELLFVYWSVVGMQMVSNVFFVLLLSSFYVL